MPDQDTFSLPSFILGSYTDLTEVCHYASLLFNTKIFYYVFGVAFFGLLIGYLWTKKKPLLVSLITWSIAATVLLSLSSIYSVMNSNMTIPLVQQIANGSSGSSSAGVADNTNQGTVVLQRLGVDPRYLPSTNPIPANNR